MKAYTCILLCSNGQYYVGSTTNLELRMQQHFASDRFLSKSKEKEHFGEHATYESGSKFIKAYKPVKLVYHEEYDRIEDAFKRERQIHGWSHAKKEALIKGDIELLKQLSKSKK